MTKEEISMKKMLKMISLSLTMTLLLSVTAFADGETSTIESEVIVVDDLNGGK